MFFCFDFQNRNDIFTLGMGSFNFLVISRPSFLVIPMVNIGLYKGSDRQK